MISCTGFPRIQNSIHNLHALSQPPKLLYGFCCAAGLFIVGDLLKSCSWVCGGLGCEAESSCCSTERSSETQNLCYLKQYFNILT